MIGAGGWSRPSICEPSVFRSPAMSDPSAVLPCALAIARPEPDEYAPYHGRYISLIQGNDIITTLESQRRQMMLLLCGRDEADGDLRYAPGKWMVKQVLGHVCDTERIFAYRRFRAGRLRAQWTVWREPAARDYRRLSCRPPRHLDSAAQSRSAGLDAPRHRQQVRDQRPRHRLPRRRTRTATPPHFGADIFRGPVRQLCRFGSVVPSRGPRFVRPEGARHPPGRSGSEIAKWPSALAAV